jgi:hypothetical protein
LASKGTGKGNSSKKVLVITFITLHQAKPLIDIDTTTQTNTAANQPTNTQTTINYPTK